MREKGADDHASGSLSLPFPSLCSSFLGSALFMAWGAAAAAARKRRASSSSSSSDSSGERGGGNGREGRQQLSLEEAGRRRRRRSSSPLSISFEKQIETVCSFDSSLMPVSAAERRETRREKRRAGGWGVIGHPRELGGFAARGGAERN